MYIFSTRSCPTCPSGLDDFSRLLLVAPQDRPTCAICLGQCQLQLGSQHLECTLLRIDGSVQWRIRLVLLAVARDQVKHDLGPACRERDLAPLFVNFLEEERGMHRRRRLVEVMPHILHLLQFLTRTAAVAVLLRLAHEAMSRSRLAALDFHELVKLEHAALAACPSFAAFVKQCLARVVDAFLTVSRAGTLSGGGIATTSLAGLVGRNDGVRLVRVGFWCRQRRWGIVITSGRR